MAKHKTTPDEKIKRPNTRREALDQIEATFKFNGWKQRERAVYLKMLGIEPKPLEKMERDEIRAIIADFTNSRMILYED